MDYRLKAGGVDTVVHCYNDSDGFEVEFVTAKGETIALLTLTAADIRPLNHAEIRWFHYLSSDVGNGVKRR
jgi:hypothetical protein